MTMAGTTTSKKSDDTDSLDEVSASREMCVHAFCVLLSGLSSSSSVSSSLSLPFDTPKSYAHKIRDGSGGVFVTWSLRPISSNRSYGLRGCIGTLKPAAAVSDAVGRYASHAAFHDPRFDPIAKHEVERLKVGVSVLSQFERADDVYDWKIGTHGIILDIDGGKWSATYLPEVAKDHDWTKEYCIQSLAEKAGYSGTLKGRALDHSVVTRYQSTKAEMTFEEFREFIGTIDQPNGFN